MGELMKMRSYVGPALLASGIAAWLAGAQLLGECLIAAAVGWSTRGIAE